MESNATIEGEFLSGCAVMYIHSVVLPSSTARRHSRRDSVLIWSKKLRDSMRDITWKSEFEESCLQGRGDLLHLGHGDDKAQMKKPIRILPRTKPRKGRFRDQAYLDWLHTQPSILPYHDVFCRAWACRITVHHVRRFGEPKN